jgi:predicted transcriptional regulator YdeE
MLKNEVQVNETKLMGIQVRTHFQNELNPLTSQIGSCVQRYWQEGIANRIPHRVNPGRLFAAYTEYDADQSGGYTYFLGEEVSDLSHIPEGLCSLVIPAGTYARFTIEPSPLPQVIMDAWSKIWQMTIEDLGGDRSYHTDFEIYDERAFNPMAAVIDVYVGIQS